MPATMMSPLRSTAIPFAESFPLPPTDVAQTRQARLPLVRSSEARLVAHAETGNISKSDSDKSRLMTILHRRKRMDRVIMPELEFIGFDLNISLTLKLIIPIKGISVHDRPPGDKGVYR